MFDGVGARGVAWRAVRYRSGQAVVLALLTVLVVAACASGPLFERAVEQASLRHTIGDAPVSARGITLHVQDPSIRSADYLKSASTLSLFAQAQTGAEVDAFITGAGRTEESTLVSRTGECGQLRIVAGRCATGFDEIVVSAPLATRLAIRVGQRTSLSLNPPAKGAKVPAYTGLRVVGTYAPFDPANDYWFDRAYAAGGTGAARGNGNQLSDAVFASGGTVAHAATLAATATEIAREPQFFIDLPLAVDRLGLDDLPALRRVLTAMGALAGAGNGVNSVDSGLSALLDDADHGRRQARSIVPLLAAQLALVALIVLGVVVVSAAEQRRPELALARLRGRTRRGAAAGFVREIGGVVAVCVLPGFVLAWVVADIAFAHWIGAGVRPELRLPVVEAVCAAALVAFTTVVVVGVRATGQPVASMLRHIPQRASRVRVGLLEAALGSAAAAGLLVILSGNRDNPVAVLTPSLIGLVGGLMLGRAVVRVAAVMGRRALWRGRMSRSTAALHIARRPGARLVVTLLVLATAVVVFATDQWTVSARNRSVRADVSVGAAAIMHVQAPSVESLQGAVRAADPSGRYATPVIVQQAPGVNAESVVAVDPARFSRIAKWGWPSSRPSAQLLARLTPKLAPPITFVGTTLRVRFAAITVTDDGVGDFAPTLGPDGRPLPPSPLLPVYLRIGLRHSDESQTSADLGPLPISSSGRALSSFVSCSGGCRITTLGLIRTVGDPHIVDVDAQLSSMSAGSPGALHLVDLRGAKDWAPTTPPVPGASSDNTDPESISVDHLGQGLHLHASEGGTTSVTAQHLDTPLAVPALVAGAPPDTRDALGNFTANGLDGLAAPFNSVGTVPVMPRMGDGSMLVDLGVIAKSTASIGASDQMVWLARDNPARERALVATLASHGVVVQSRESAAAQRAAFAASAPAWSTQLAIIAAIVASLMAAALIVMAVITTRRSRLYDLAALRIVGTPRPVLLRGALLEQFVIVVVGVLTGAVIGVVSAHLAMPSIPIFLRQDGVTEIRLPIAWASVVAAAVAVAVVLCAVGAIAAVRLIRQADSEWLREGQL